MSELSQKEKKLHSLSAIVAKKNIDVQLEQATLTLDFLLDIQYKTEEEDLKVENARKLLDILGSIEYENDLKNILVEKYSSLSDEHLDRFLRDLEYEKALNNVAFEATPAIIELQEKHIIGTLPKGSLH